MIKQQRCCLTEEIFKLLRKNSINQEQLSVTQNELNVQKKLCGIFLGGQLNRTLLFQCCFINDKIFVQFFFSLSIV